VCGSNSNTAIPTNPIWVGAWVWLGSDLPSDLAPSPEKKVMIKTEGGHSSYSTTRPAPAALRCKPTSGQKVVINSNGIGDRRWSGRKDQAGWPQVSINDGALDVM